MHIGKCMYLALAANIYVDVERCFVMPKLESAARNRFALSIEEAKVRPVGSESATIFILGIANENGHRLDRGQK